MWNIENEINQCRIHIKTGLDASENEEQSILNNNIINSVLPDETLNNSSRDSDEDSSYNEVARTFSKRRLIEEDETEENKENEAINSQQKFFLQ